MGPAKDKHGVRESFAKVAVPGKGNFDQPPYIYIYMCECVYISDKMSNRMPDGMSEYMPETVPDRMSEYVSNRFK